MFEFFDKELGKILVTPHKRAKRVIARRKSDHIQLTVPYRFTMRQVSSLLQEMKPQISRIKPLSRPIFAEGDKISSFTFDAQIVRTAYVEKPALSLKERNLHIYMPQRSDLSLPANQQFIKEAIIGVLRIEAKRILPVKADSFARKHGLSYHDIKINSSKGRWGSCSAQKDINFSLFLMLLPEKLIDYVVLHELTHTVEMNHGERFWVLLDRFCDGQARKLSRKVKKFKPDWYDFLVQD